jgi:phage tail sheath gpL-like
VPGGLTVTVTAMSGGATDPSYTAAITAMAEDQYHTVVSGLCTSTVVGAFVTELESRWGPMRQIEGVLFAAFADTRANLTTLGNSFNSWPSCSAAWKSARSCARLGKSPRPPPP